MNWKCPHCQVPQILTAQNRDTSVRLIDEGYTGTDQAMVRWTSTRCLNQDCRQRTFSVGLFKLGARTPEGRQTGDPIKIWHLLPEGSAKPQPPYIPEGIVADYREACVIRDLSPKASATLARRCLQGMIRDFCGISKDRLFDEIRELKRLVAENAAPRGVDEDAVAAIDNVRKIGNIGAHMEKDVGVIIDVDPDEAQVLIELIESLFEEWYVARHAREQRFAKLNSIAGEKVAAKKPIEAIPTEPEPLAITSSTTEG